MSLEENKALVRRFINEYNARNLEMFDELVASGYIDHTHRQKGLEAFRRLFSLAFVAFPDWHEEIEAMIAEGDMVWVRVNATGTHRGEWNLSGVPLPPTGKNVSMRMVFVWRIENGRLAEGWEVDDSLGFMVALGLVTCTEKGKKVFGEEAHQGT